MGDREIIKILLYLDTILMVQYTQLYDLTPLLDIARRDVLVQPTAESREELRGALEASNQIYSHGTSLGPYERSPIP